MIPLSQPGTELVRIGEPFERRRLKRTRVLKAGPVVVDDVQRFVPVRCTCGHSYDMLLSAWLHRPPLRCLRCHHRGLRTDGDRLRKHAAYMAGFADGASGRERPACALPGYDAGYDYGCKVRARVAKTAARKMRIPMPRELKARAGRKGAAA